MEPQRKSRATDGIQPDIRPRFGVIQGGGETSAPQSGHLSAVPNAKESDVEPAEGLRALEGGGETSAPKQGHLASVKDSEENPPDRSGFSAADDINEKIGKGYTGKDSTQSKTLSKLYSSNSGFKKKIAIAGAAAGGSVIGGVLIFLALLPLKIEHIVTNLETRFNATAENAIGTETQNAFSAWVTKEILPNLHKGACHSTIHPGCVSVAPGDSPIAKLFNGWKDGKLEQKLATDHGIVFGTSAKSSSSYIMTVDGKDFDINKDNIFDFKDSSGKKLSATTRNELRHTVNDALKSGTLWDKTYVRFKVNLLLDRKYGTKLCVIACDSRDKFTDKIADKKLAAKAYIVNRVVTPLSESYGLIIQCIMGGGCETALADAAPGDDIKQSPFQKKLQEQLASYAAGDTEKLAKLVGTANGISEDGFTKYIARQIGEKIAGEVGGKAAGDAVPVVGWALLIGQLVEIGGNLGPIVQYAGYAANSAAAVQLYEAYNTVASEMRSGHIDPTELGSFNEALSTNLSGSSDDQSDATSTPLYNSLLGETTPTSASIFGSLFGLASADPSTDTSSYKCNDGSSVPAGKLVCPEEELAKGNGFANELSKTINGITSAVPGFRWLLKGINMINSAIGAAIGPALSTACDALHIPLTDIGCTGAMNYLGGEASQLMSFITNKMVPSPVDNNMSGGRTFDMMTAGADASYNKVCQVSLGCTQISDVAMTNIQNEQIAEQKQEFDNQSMFARIFDTNSSYSLVSRLAMDMPASMSTATNNSIGSLIANPFGKIFNGLSSIFSGNMAFAQTTAHPDPFGIVQYGYNASDIPTDPEAYWDNNCVSGPMATYDKTTQKLDVSNWMNNSANVSQDKNTGEALNLKPNPCLLIQATVQSAGGMFDTSLLPSDSQNGEGDSTGGTTASGVTGDAATLAQKLLDAAAAGKVVLTDSTTSDLQKTVQGQQVYIGDSAQGGGKCSPALPTNINATLLQVLLNISANYKIKIQNIVSGHPCDTLKHSTGHASDIFQINGVDLNDAWWAKPDAITITNNIAKIEHDTDPSNAFGLGVGCSAYGKITTASNIMVFSDSGNFGNWNSGCSGSPNGQDEIHVDVRGGS
jgi:hypothetical protein